MEFFFGLFIGATLGVAGMAMSMIARIRDCDELAERHNDLLRDHERLNGMYARLEKFAARHER